MSAVPDIVGRYLQALDGKTDEDLEALAYKSPAAHFGLFMEIKDKNGKWIRPEPNVLQLRISEVIETLREECPGLRIRIVAVKPRRAGLSTFSLFCGYHESMRRPIEGITIADCKDNSEMLTEKLTEYSTHDSFPWGVRQTQDATGEKAWSNGSRWVVDTAENPDAGVGGTRHFGHFSEVAKFPQTRVKNDVKTMTAALPSLDGDETIAIAESTPEMASGWFHNTFTVSGMWLEDFMKKWHNEGYRPGEQWIKVFAAWWEFADYRRQQPVGAIERQEIDETLTKVETEERARYKLTYEQLAWRRDTIRDVCNGDAKIFAFYYPSDPVSCWVAGGAPRFDMQRLAEWEVRAKQVPPESGYLVKQDRGNVIFSAQHDGTGDILIFERPLPGCKYCVVIDPAESTSQTIGADTDPHSLTVWRAAYHDTHLDRWMKSKLVARLRPPFRGEEDDLAPHAIRLCIFYGRAIIAPETNKGFHTLRILQEAGLPIYKRRPLSHRTGKIEEQYGFKTDEMNREAIIAGLATAISYDQLEILCPHMVGEMKTFIRGPKRAEAAPNKHDDDVMGAAIAWEVLPSATEYTRHEAQHQDPVDDQGWKGAAWKW
jgi:hypothetical protein